MCASFPAAPHGPATSGSLTCRQFAVSQRESLRFGVPLSEGQFVITVYWRSDVRASYRMTEPDSDRTFQILGYSDPTGALEQLDLLVVEVL